MRKVYIHLQTGVGSLRTRLKIIKKQVNFFRILEGILEKLRGRHTEAVEGISWIAQKRMIHRTLQGYLAHKKSPPPTTLQ